MAIGAIAALEAAGKEPGKDILVVSIDGEKDALQAIVDGKLGATCECNPTLRAQGLRDHDGATPTARAIPTLIINPDRSSTKATRRPTSARLLNLRPHEAR